MGTRRWKLDLQLEGWMSSAGALVYEKSWLYIYYGIMSSVYTSESS